MNSAASSELFIIVFYVLTLFIVDSGIGYIITVTYPPYSAFKIVRWPTLVRFRSKSQNTHYSGQIYVNIIMWCCVYAIYNITLLFIN